MNSIDQITNFLTGRNKEFKIGVDEYNQWKKQWIFDALKDYRLGKSFCMYFDIDNSHILYHLKDDQISEQWIKNNYILK